ncbi:Long-chain-fatty-acid-coa ligase [Globisporangium polare]
MATAPVGFSRVLPGTERPGHGPVHRSMHQTRHPIPPNSENPDNPFVGLTLPEAESSFHNFQSSCEKFKSFPCLGYRSIVDGEAQEYSWFTYEQIYSRVSHLGSGLMSRELMPSSADGTRMVAIYMKNSLDWIVAEQAAYMFSTVVVALYDTLGAESTEYILNQTELATIICTATELKKLTQLRAKCPHLKNVVICGASDDEAESAAKAAELNVFHYSAIESEGEVSPLPPIPPTGSSLATLMYTSGTTGEPKGVELTHSNFMSACAATFDFLETGDVEFSTHTVHLCYLPLAHIYERTVQVSVFNKGGRVGFSQNNPLKILDDLRVLRPTLFCGVPRLLNRIYDQITAKMAAAPKILSYLFATALSIKIKRFKKFGVVEHAFWDRLFFKKITESLGLDKCQLMFSGSAPLSPDVINFCRVVFMTRVLEGYGQTETCSGASSSGMADRSAGYIGGPGTAVEMKLTSVPDMNYNVTDREHGDERLPCIGRGEICIRGPTLFRGYYKQPEKTAEAFDEEGWMHTGDIGLWSPLGQLKIIDRKKNIFKLSQGEYVAPEKVEIALGTCSSIAQLFVTGDSFHSHLVAIVVPDELVLRKLAAAHGISDPKLSMAELCDQPLLKKLVQQEIDDAGAKAKLPGFERVRQIYLHHELLSVENELLTPTFKVKRAEAQKFFKKQIDQLYQLSGDSVAGKNITQS